MTCRLPLTSPHNGQLRSTHQSLSAKNFDTQNLVEITSFDNQENSACVRDGFILCVSGPMSPFLCAASKLSSALNATFTSPLLIAWSTYILEELLLIYRLIRILCQGCWLSFKDNNVRTAILLRGSCLSAIWKS